MPYKDPEKQKEYSAKHYRENKEYYAKKNTVHRKAARARNKAFVNRVKSQFGCAACGYDKSIWALEFHHKDETKKDINISKLSTGGWSIGRIKEEMRKCVVLCANCHRETHEEVSQGIIHNWEPK